MKRTLVTTLTLLALACCQIAAAAKTAAPKVAPKADPIAKAREFFQHYVALEHAFDPAMADLYRDDAKILNKRYQNGKMTPLQIPALRYKHYVRDGMAAARQKGDVAQYTNDTYTLEGDRVRINVTRYLVLKKYSSPMSILVGPDATGKWVIYEETSESHL